MQANAIGLRSRDGRRWAAIRAKGRIRRISGSARAPFERLTQQNNPGQFGSEGRNAVRGPGYGKVDFPLFKNFVFAESNRLQFRAEAFNAFNRANFALPENDLNSPAFGQILQAAPPRLVQLALKFLF
jgi:hypothetical protein